MKTPMIIFLIVASIVLLKARKKKMDRRLKCGEIK